MIVTFQSKAGKTLTGKVIWTGHYNVDKPESHKVLVKEFPHLVFWVPVNEVAS